MDNKLTIRAGIIAALTVTVLCAGVAQAAIPGLTGTDFTLTAKADYIITPEANRILMWGLANGAGSMQFPGPTLIVAKGATVNITLNNELAVPTSLVFPGQTGVSAVGGTPGLITAEAAPGGSVTYSFVASMPGTYQYHSGTDMQLQVEMGLVGALIVRPAIGAGTRAYGHDDSLYNDEILFLESEVDPVIHELVESGRADEVDFTAWRPTYWFINGRCFPDTLLPAGAGALPNQPYNCLPLMEPGQRLLLRFISAGRDYHPFHTHGNNFLLIARDARLLSTGVGADLALSDFTLTVPPGGTADAIFTWTGAKMGWDIYGHLGDEDNAPLLDFPGPGDVDHNGNGVFDALPALEPGEDPSDHGLPFPVVLPERKDLSFGVFYSGSPYLGVGGALPPGQGKLNLFSGFFHIWHSHRETEIINNGVFPGGMITMLVIVPPGTLGP